MRFVTIIIFAVIGRFLALATATPVPIREAGGMTIPLARHRNSFLNNQSIDLNAISSHARSIGERVLSGLDNYKMNTGTIHPFAGKRTESEVGTRGASIPLTPGYFVMMWRGEISIGTPPKTLNVFVDTGAADIWVLQTGCAGIPGNHRDLWDPHSSESAKKQNQPFQLRYSVGYMVEGDGYTDNVTIAGFTSDPQYFGSATLFADAESHNNAFADADGLLGLAFPSISTHGLDYSLFESLIRQRKVANPTFSLKLSSSGAEMYVGGTNSRLYTGDITYTHVTNHGFWQVSMDNLRVNGDIILEDVPVIFDTGANFIFGDWNRVAELYRPLHASLFKNGDLGYYYLPCNSFPTLGLTFGGRTFEILPEVLNIGRIGEGSAFCFSGVIAQRANFEFWNVGITFLQGVYSVFNYETSQVGFADLA